MARPDLTVPWDTSASLIGVRDLPIHGTVASCIRAWRAANPDKRAEAMLATAKPLKAMPFRIAIAGHTSAAREPPRASYGPWDLSADRANAIRRILEAEGVPTAHFFAVAGRADTQPLFPDDPYIAANRRVTITLMREEPPMPQGAKP